jgi:hypothetical protein
LNQQILAWQPSIRAHASISRHGAVDYARIDAPKLVVANAEPLRHPRSKVLQHNIVLSHQLLNNLLATIFLQVDRQAALIAIECQKRAIHRGQPSIASSYTPVPLTATDGLDLENVGA